MRNTSKLLFVALVMIMFFMRPALSYADWNGHNGGSGHSGGYSHNGGYNHGGWHGGHSYVGINFSVWPDSYYYGAPYYPYYPPADEVLVSPPVTVVEQPQTVIEPPAVVDNQIPNAAPVITSSVAAGETPDSITINIPNNKGSYTAVTLKKSGSGFIGPQGEFYTEFPKVSQLTVIYGK